MKEYDITPVTKPRMTRSDQWKTAKTGKNKKRPEVAKYHAYQNEVILKKVMVPSQCHVTFIMPMAKSWSDKKKREHHGKPHQQTPDIDNLGKALLDAIYKNDSHIWDIRFTKIWGLTGKIIIYDTVCSWGLDNDQYWVYATGCGNDFMLIDGTPKENDIKYCPYCGNEIK